MSNKEIVFEKGFIALLLLSAIVLLFWLFSDFLAAIFFSALIAIATFGYYQKLTNYFKSAYLAPLLATFLVSVLLILPLSYVLVIFALEVPKLVAHLQLDQKTLFILLQKLSTSLPFIHSFDAEIKAYFEENIASIILSIKSVALYLVTSVFTLASNFFTFLAISLFSLYYFYQDGLRIVESIRQLLPLSDDLSHIIVKEFFGLSIILVSGVFLIALMQGVAFALVMAFFDMPWLFFGILVALASFIPVIGAALIWLPVTIFFYSQGQIYQAVFVAFWGMAVIGGVIDNIVRPLLLKKMAQKIGKKHILEHTLITVLSTFAGIIKFGILGLFLGPIIAAMSITIFNLYYLKYKAKQ